MIRDRFRDQLRISEIATLAGMSESSLQEHFRSVTPLSPLEYQRQLRLQEVRRLMLFEGVNAGSAGFAVGYESPSQFSREYRRLFGAPPRQDIERLQISRRLPQRGMIEAHFANLAYEGRRQASDHLPMFRLASALRVCSRRGSRTAVFRAGACE